MNSTVVAVQQAETNKSERLILFFLVAMHRNIFASYIKKGKRKTKAGANEVVKKQRRDQDHWII